MIKQYLTCLVVVFAIKANSQTAWNYELVYNWNDTTIIGTWAYNNVYNSVYGFVMNGREFAVIGSTDGTHIFDITDGANSTMVAYVPGREQGDNIVHREYNYYSGYVYAVTDEGDGSLQIIDCNQLPGSFSLVYDEDSLIKTSHTVEVDTVNAKIYFNIANHQSNVVVCSLADPEDPQLLVEYINAGSIHDCYVVNDTAFLNASNNGMHVVDFSDAQNPVELGSITNYPFMGYNHSGWRNLAGDIYLMCDENHGYEVKVLDVSDLTDIQTLSTFTSGVDSNSVPHNVQMRGDVAYFSYYHDGLQVFDIADPANPVKIGYYDTYSPTDHDSYRGAWGVYAGLPSGRILISDMQYGLFVLQEIDTTLSIANEIRDSDHYKINTYPQPASGFFMAEIFTHQQVDAVFSLVDLQGRIVLNLEKQLHQGNNSLRFDLPQIESGIYLLKAKIDDQNISSKIVIAK